MMRPPIKAGKAFLARVMKMVDSLPSKLLPKYFLPTKATTVAMIKIRMVHVLPMILDFFISFSDLMEMYLTMMCGIPK